MKNIYTVTRAAVLLVCLFVAGTSQLVFPTHAHANQPTITANGVLAHTNVERFKEGLPFLASNATLTTVAKRKMTDMFARQYFAHESPTGETLADLAKEAGYAYITVGENLALGGFKDSKDVVTAWMNSPGHRANILKAGYTEIGIAAGRSVYEGRDAWIIVQEFGLPRSACAAPDTVLRAQVTESENMLDFLDGIAARRNAAYKATSDRDMLEVRVREYNKAVDVYNERVAAHKKLIARYNKTVEAFNKCVNSKTDNGKH